MKKYNQSIFWPKNITSLSKSSIKPKSCSTWFSLGLYYFYSVQSMFRRRWFPVHHMWFFLFTYILFDWYKSWWNPLFVKQFMFIGWRNTSQPLTRPVEPTFDKKRLIQKVKQLMGHSTEMSTQTICRLQIVYDILLRSLSVLLLAAIWAKLIGPYGGLAFDKQAIKRESTHVEWPR